MQRPVMTFFTGEDPAAIRRQYAYLRARHGERGAFWAGSEAFAGKPYAIERGGLAAIEWERDPEILDLRDKLERDAEDDELIDTPEKANRALVALHRDKFMCPKTRKVRFEIIMGICKLNGWIVGNNAAAQKPAPAEPPQIIIEAYPDDTGTTYTPAT